jgi:hypothetical protein
MNQNIQAEAQITFFFRPYPEFAFTDEDTAKTCKKCANPDYSSRQVIKGLIDQNLVSGIYATYGGFIASSSADGQIAFPRKHEAPLVHLVETTRITPITMNSTTIAHWQLEDKVPATLYKVERQQDDATGIYFWDVTKEEIPNNKQLPLTSILIFAKPDNLYIPTGITVTDDTPNLHLPDIYVKPEINKVSNAFYVLYLRHFFGPVKNALKKEKKQYAINLTY